MTLRRAQENLRLSCPSCEQRLDASGVPAFEEIACPNCSFQFAVPYRFGQYLLDEAISETRFAGVYRAQDLKLRRQVAIKVLYAELAGDIRIVEDFLGAARRTAILNHVNILPIYSCDCTDGLPYIVMEHMAGRCLYHRLCNMREPLPIAESVGFCEHAARGLDFAHREGVDHDGLRPTNLLWDGENNVKIADFGMHEFKRNCADALHLDWRAFLHAGYTSPEILQGECNGGLACDIFGLGTTLYHLLTGRRPFSNTVESRMEQLAGIPLSPGDLRPDTPPELSDYVMRMIAYDPAARPHGYREIISTLFKIKEGLAHPPAPRKRGGPPKRVLTGGPAVARLNSPPRSRGKRQRKRRHLTHVLLALVSLAVLAAVGFHILRQRPPRTAAEVVEWAPAAAGGARRPGPFADRPIPEDFTFNLENPDIRRHLQRIPRRFHNDEVARLAVLGGVRSHVRQLMRYLPYEGASGVRLRSGRMIDGSVPFCNDEGLSVRRRDGELVHLKWDELSPRQYVAFLEYYVDQRQGRGSLRHEERLGVARDYMLLAVICDWLGDTDTATVFAKNAAGADPSTGRRVRELLPYLSF